MPILVHVCCGPCAIAVLEALQQEQHEIAAFFYNPNIHPLAEYLRRREGAMQTAALYDVPVILADTLPEEAQHLALVPPNFPWPSQEQGETDKPSAPAGTALAPLPQVPLSARHPVPPAVNPVPWLRAMHGHEGERCLFCWYSRLEGTARYAKAHGFEAITTTLFYSRYQNQEQVQRMAALAAQAHGVTVYYQDFRPLWQRGVDLSKAKGIYRQQYCGCVFSEYERYAKQLHTEIGNTYLKTE
ncbi:epoxyqueuosine reductase QueH [Desulfovibrio cuneatus]|uniref:epoxyqueuosine reductase QueH n=1 Tax=Desulfovibrio cuneatus TaxID=159728 RepID=UPI0004836C53|nr:epoxyqueuosine reductase QueH [Desulfovibrio cuneatus]